MYKAFLVFKAVHQSMAYDLCLKGETNGTEH